ncbi:hypothetical protein [Nostoc sp.]|uniref:hypothetical protein n=1 Tax=Nostoc sp. TaxID=1180 RepID=UPI002FF558C6
MTLTGYGPLCTEVYEITKPINQDYPDVIYYIRHLSSIAGRILEAMVGTGRLLIRLLEAGINIEGMILHHRCWLLVESTVMSGI